MIGSYSIMNSLFCVGLHINCELDSVQVNLLVCIVCCELPELGREVPFDLDFDGNVACVPDLDFIRANLVPTYDITSRIKPVIVRPVIHDFRFDNHVGGGAEIQFYFLIDGDIFEIRLARVGQVALFAGGSIDFEQSTGDGSIAELVLGIVFEAQESNDICAVTLFLVFIEIHDRYGVGIEAQ